MLLLSSLLTRLGLTRQTGDACNARDGTIVTHVSINSPTERSDEIAASGHRGEGASSSVLEVFIK